MAGKCIVILGPPGSGKGTQAVRIAGELGIKHLSTGDLLREGVARKTGLGLEAEGYMKRGDLVPDEIMLGLIHEELGRMGDSGWILDGYPRTLPQAESRSGMLEEQGRSIDHVVFVDVNPEVIVRRLTSRRICSGCNAVHNLEMEDMSEGDGCRECGGELVKRPDDDEETVRRRLEVYGIQTAQVVDYYRRQNRLVPVDGAAGIDEVTAEILRNVK